MASNRKPNPFNRVRWNSTRKAGVLRLFQRIVQRTVPCWIFDSNSLVAVDYDLEEWRHIQPDKNWHHMWVHKQDDHLIRNGGMSDTEIQSFRRINARAHVIVKDGETVAYSWLVPDSRHIFDWIQVILAPGELYSSGAFVAHSYRGQRLQGELKKIGWSQLANENYSRMVTFIERLNLSSLKSQVKPARRYVGRLTYLRLLGLVIYDLDGNWGVGFWNRRNPFKLSFDIFDRSVSRPPKGAAT